MTVAELDLYKDIISVDEIEDQITTTLRFWMPSYQAEVCRQRGIDPTSLPAIRSWTTMQNFRKAPEEQTPAVVLINAGTNGAPAKAGAGWYRAQFVIALAVITSALDGDASNKVSKIYQAALRAIMLQKKAGGNMITDVEWVGESYDELDAGTKAMLASATGTFQVVADGLVKATGAGPLVPDLDAPDDLPVVLADKGRTSTIPKED